MYYNSVSMDQCHISMCHGAVAWISHTYMCHGAEGNMMLLHGLHSKRVVLIVQCCVENLITLVQVSFTSAPIFWIKSSYMEIEEPTSFVKIVFIISDPRRGRFMGLLAFIFFFFRHDFVRAIYLEPLLAETPN